MSSLSLFLHREPSWLLFHAHCPSHTTGRILSQGSHFLMQNSFHFSASVCTIPEQAPFRRPLSQVPIPPLAALPLFLPLPCLPRHPQHQLRCSALLLPPPAALDAAILPGCLLCRAAPAGGGCGCCWHGGLMAVDRVIICAALCLIRAVKGGRDFPYSIHALHPLRPCCTVQ